MPDKAERLWGQLGERGPVASASLEAALEAPPGSFDEPVELFTKVEDDRVAELNETLRERVEAASDDPSDDEDEDEDEADLADASFDVEPVADERVDFETFERLDIRVGRILTAEPIEDSDNLMRLEVDIGVETRQVVAGIKGLYDPDHLPGTQCVLLANLERAELFGYESDGMLLAAGEDADMLRTHGDSDPGTKIR